MKASFLALSSSAASSVKPKLVIVSSVVPLRKTRRKPDDLAVLVPGRAWAQYAASPRSETSLKLILGSGRYLTDLLTGSGLATLVRLRDTMILFPVVVNAPGPRNSHAEKTSWPFVVCREELIGSSRVRPKTDSTFALVTNSQAVLGWAAEAGTATTPSQTRSAQHTTGYRGIRGPPHGLMFLASSGRLTARRSSTRSRPNPLPGRRASPW